MRLFSSSKQLLNDALLKVRDFFGHPLASAFLGAVVATVLGAFYQSQILDRQLLHDDTVRRDSIARKRLATSIILTNQLAGIQGQVVAFKSAKNPVFVSTARGWKISSDPLLKWGSEDLSLFESQFLAHYGTLVATLDTLESRVDLVGINHRNNDGEQLSTEEFDTLQSELTSALISSNYLMQELIKIYRASKVPIQDSSEPWMPPTPAN